MSRPSDIYNTQCSAQPGYNYLVVGNTLSSLLQVIDLYESSAPIIYFLTEGSNSVMGTGVADMNFAIRHIRSILEYLVAFKVKRIYCGGRTTVDSYYIGAGIVGNFVAAYYVPRVGPWSSSEDTRWSDFVGANTRIRGNTPQENLVVERLAAAFSIKITGNVSNDTPSILNQVYAFVSECGACDSRRLFRAKVSSVNSMREVIKLCNPCSIDAVQLMTDNDGPVYNMTIQDHVIPNAKIKWRCHPYMFLRYMEYMTRGEGCCLELPSFYRSILSIPIVNRRGVNLSEFTTNGSPIDGDQLSTYISFSIGDSGCDSSELAWNVCAYTTLEDASQIGSGGKFASNNHTLLIVEAVCNVNQRKHIYDTRRGTINVEINSMETENGFLVKFAAIVAEIYSAYTGNEIPLEDILDAERACSKDVCTIISPTIEGGGRESPLEMILQMNALLFGHRRCRAGYPSFSL